MYAFLLCGIVFLKQFKHYALAPAVYQSSKCLLASSTLCVISLFNICHSTECTVVSLCISVFWARFLAVWRSSFVKYLFVLYVLLQDYPSKFLTNWSEFFCYSRCEHFIRYVCCNIIFYTIASLFTLLMVYFGEQFVPFLVF